MIGKNGPWIAMPSIKMLDCDGNPLLNADKNKQIVEFKDRATRDRFCEMVLALARRSHPDALNGDAP